jgi:FkbH-like protein
MTSRNLNVAIVCSFNLDLLKRPLMESLRGAGLNADLYFSGYGQWESESLNPQSALHLFKPAVIVLFADWAELIPALHPGDMLSRQVEATQTAGAAFSRLKAAIDGSLVGSPEATILVHNFARAKISALGTLSENAGYSSAASIEAANEQIRLLAETNPRVRVIDFASFVSEHGQATLYDDRLWHLARMRLGRVGLEHLATLYRRYLLALTTPRRKCLVLDLDNTLWGGVLGEDGTEGIVIGQEGIGLAFREFQLAILALAQRGVVLAIASKNNPADALEVLDNHPEMVLRPRDFACLEIHWNPKSESLPRIADQLNLGLDSFVFWDDEPREREIVRDQHPSVLVPDVPADPSAYARTLLNLECFDVLSLTDEDRRRGEMYRQEASRQQWLSNVSPSNLDEFYRSLQMTVSIDRPDGYTVSRFAQLTQRTNQFNFTTQRYTESEIRAKLSDESRDLRTVSLKDRFGDLGVVGAAIVNRGAGLWELDTFLMSCRALGRGVEDAFLAALASEAKKAGVILCGKFIPSKKNEPARQFLDRLRFPTEVDADSSLRFKIDPAAVAFPPWISRADRSVRQ